MLLTFDSNDVMTHLPQSECMLPDVIHYLMSLCPTQDHECESENFIHLEPEGKGMPLPDDFLSYRQFSVRQGISWSRLNRSKKIFTCSSVLWKSLGCSVKCGRRFPSQNSKRFFIDSVKNSAVARTLRQDLRIELLYNELIRNVA